MATLDIIVKPKLKFSLKRCGEVVPYGITPEEREKLAGIEENANNYTHPETHPSSILDVVDVVNGAANKFLNERGEMVAVATSSIGVTGSPLYASTSNSDVAGYKSLAGTPQALETETTLTAKSSNGIVWGDKYLSAPFTEAVTIPATAYGFDYWRKVSASNGTSRKHLRVFIYRAGVETNIITPLASPDIDDTEFTERQISYIFHELALLAGDRIGIQEGFSTTHANNITLTYIVGDGRGWFMRLPLPLKHEALTDKNSEAAFQHVDTTTTKLALDAADMVAIKDSVTGRMVLTPKSNLQTNIVQSTGTSETDVMSQKAVTDELANNPIATYLFNSNPEIVVSSINYDTNIITSPNHGLVDGDTVVATLNVDTNLFARDVVPTNIAVVNPLFKIINATTDTFQITKYDVIVDIVEKVTIDMTKWHFEKINTSFVAISITGLPSLKRCRINVLQRTGNMVYFRVSPSSWTYANISGSLSAYDTATFFGFALYDVYIDVESKTLRMAGAYMKQDTGVSFYTITPLDRAAYVYPSTLTEITEITLQFGFVGGIVNGTEIKIFKV